MSEMVDRLVRARITLEIQNEGNGWWRIVSYEYGYPEILVGRFPDGPTARAEADRWQASAILKALREPTEAMVEANGCCELTREQVREGWRAMIDEAMR